jgi:hypothetical protein
MILTNENKKFLAKCVDDAIKLKGVLELIDGYMAQYSLTIIENIIEKNVEVGEPLKDNLNRLVEAVEAKDLEAVEVLAATILDSVINIPGLDDESEKLMFEGAVKLIVGALKIALK